MSTSFQAAAQTDARAPLAQSATTEDARARAIDVAVRRGAVWLRERQRDDGSFAPASGEGSCNVALSAMALWSLGALGADAIDDAHCRAGAAFLRSHVRQDGGIYDPARGLAVYTSGVATQALRALAPRAGDAELASVIHDVELFVYRHGSPESLVDALAPEERSVADSTGAARALLDQSAKLPDERRKALEFLANCRRDALRTPERLRSPNQPAPNPGVDAFSYEDLLPFVYLDLAPEHTIALKATNALRTYYAADRNPDLTKRYGPAGFQPGTQGLFYYYLVVARALSTTGARELETADGVRHDWASEISQRLLELQRPEGNWINQDARWWEHEPVLVTSYALLTLQHCREALLRANGKAR